MSCFLYFVSGRGTPVKREDLAKLGLEYAFTSSLQNCEVRGNTPSGQNGYVCCDAKRSGDRTAGYYPDQQTWREMPKRPDGTRVWIGYWNEAKPTPDSLERASTLPGARLKLADDRMWLVPIVRIHDRQTDTYKSNLPTYLDFDAEGRVVPGRVVDAYQRLWELTAPVAEREFGQAESDTDKDLATQQLYTAVVALLQANYVVALPELVMIDALADDCLALLVQISCRFDQLREWIAASKGDEQKKTTSSPTPPGSSTSAGDEG
jgi:hypothetical protein